MSELAALEPQTPDPQVAGQARSRAETPFLPLFARLDERDALRELADQDPAARLALAWLEREIDPAGSSRLAEAALQAAGRAGWLPERLGRAEARLRLIDAWQASALRTADEARALGEQALAQFQALGDALGECDACILLQNLDSDIGEYARAIAGCEAALAAAERAGDRQRGAYLRLRRFNLSLQDGQPVPAEEQLPSADAVVRAQQLHSQLFTRSMDGHYEAVQQQSGEALEAQLAQGMQRGAINAALLGASAGNNAQRMELAVHWAERALELARLSWPQRVPRALVSLGVALRHVGHYSQARQILEQAQALQAHSPHSQIYILVIEHLAQIDLVESRPEASLERLDAVLGDPGAAHYFLHRELQLLRCQALLALNRAAEALQTGEALVREERRASPVGQRFKAEVVCATALLALGRPTEARDAALDLIARAEGAAEFRLPHELLLTASQALAACGDFEAACRLAWRADELRAQNFSEMTGQRAQVSFARHQIERARLEAEHLRTVGEMTAARLQALERAHEVAGHLAEIGKELSAKLDLGETLGLIERHVTRLLAARGVAIFLAEDERLSLAHASGGAAPAADDEALARCAREGRLLIAEGGRCHAPLLSGTRRLGVMTIATDTPLDEQALAIFGSLCAYAGIALDNARAYRDLASAQAKLRAQERMASMGVLVAGISHELNTPLGNAQLSASALSHAAVQLEEGLAAGTLRRSQMEELIGQMRGGVGVIEHSLQRLMALSADFKQVAQDRSRYMRQRVQVIELVRQAFHVCQLETTSTGLRLEVDVGEALILRTFPDPLIQALAIALANAWQHGLARGAGHIRVHAESRGAGLRLSVEDDGAGMPDEVRRRAFEPFFTTRMGPHTGLGLTILHGIVTDTLGGEVSLASAPGQGTTLSLDLPLEAPE